MKSVGGHDDILGELIKDSVQHGVRLASVESHQNVLDKIIMEGNNGQPPVLGQLLVLNEGFDRLQKAQQEQATKIAAITRSEDEIRKEKIKGYFAVVLAIIGGLCGVVTAYLTFRSK